MAASVITLAIDLYNTNEACFQKLTHDEVSRTLNEDIMEQLKQPPQPVQLLDASQVQQTDSIQRSLELWDQYPSLTRMIFSGTDSEARDQSLAEFRTFYVEFAQSIRHDLLSHKRTSFAY